MFHMEPPRLQHQGKQPFKPLFHVHFVYKRSKHAYMEVKDDLTNLQLTLILNFILLFSGDRVSLCSPDHTGTHSVDHADLELTETEETEPLPSKRCYQRRAPLCQSLNSILKELYFSHCGLEVVFFFLIHISKLILSLGTLSLSFWSQIVCKGIKEREVGSLLHLEVQLQMGEYRMLTDDVIGCIFLTLSCRPGAQVITVFKPLCWGPRQGSTVGPELTLESCA